MFVKKTNLYGVLFSLFFLPSVLKASSASELTKKAQKSAEKSPLSVSVDFDFMTNANKEEESLIENMDSVIFTFINYQLTESDSLRLMPILTHNINFRTEKGSNITMDQVELRYKRVLVPKSSQGIDLSAEARYSYYTNNQSRQKTQSYGYAQGRLTSTKVFSDSFSLIGQLRIYQYHHRLATMPANLSDTQYRGYLIPTYKINKKVTVDTALRYLHLTKTGGAKSLETATLIPSVTYSFTEKFSANLYAMIVPLKSSDDQTFAQDFEKEINYGLTLSATLF